MVTSSCRHPESDTVRRMLASLAIPCCAAILAGCAAIGPAADQLYPAHAASPDRVPVILIPGLLGSRLARARDGVEVWPGGTRKLLTSDYLDLALRIDPDTLEPVDDGLVPSGIFEGAVGKDFYGRLMQELREAGGYRLMRPGRPVVQQRARLYVFTYDWRQDNVETVKKLDELIEQIRSDYGDPELRVDVIAHSMGGLVVRYFERYGPVDVLDGNSFTVTGLGRSKLRRVVLLGTPNQGTVTAVHKFLNGYRVGFSALPTEGVATMPSTFQLFPHPLVDWVVNVNGRPLDFDVFDIEFWRRYGWSIFDPRIQRRMDRHRDVWPQQDVFERWFERRLERGRRFVWSLMVPSGRVPLVKPLLLGSDCVPTPSRLVFENVGGESVARLRPEQILVPTPGVDYETLMFAPGDGSVTLASLLSRQDLSSEVPSYEQESLETERNLIVCERHDALTSEDALLDALIGYLLEPGPGAVTGP
jgi:pimeloyl-ACP methyl ester carboxylesterase